MDVQVDYAITQGLRDRGVDVLTAQEDGAARLQDPQMLDRAMILGRVLFTQDADFLREASQRHRIKEAFAGIIYGHQRNVTIGQCVKDLEIIAKIVESAELESQVMYLPL
jgi:predicted nuclease of predicted toxin-antitoxin system